MLRNLAQRRFRASIVDKALSRASFVRHRHERPAVESWCASVAQDLDAFMHRVDPALAAETVRFGRQLQAHASLVLTPMGIPAGKAAGEHRLLYFLVRLLRPETVVETGVAFGYSSAAILAALSANEAGTLWSSDLPYVREDRPERLVGVVVEPSLRDRWELLLDGDDRNLPRIAERAGSIDLLHYDSDKSWRGRTRALQVLRHRFSPEATLVFDDVQDNWHFRRLVDGPFPWHAVFGRSGYYAGVARQVPLAEAL